MARDNDVRPVLDLESITEAFKTALVEYNEENATMNLVLLVIL